MERKLWHRQPEETRRAAEAFRVYRDMGDERSLEKVGIALGKSTALIERWSARYGWVNRIKAYEDYLDQIRLEANRKAIVEMSERQANNALVLQNLGMTRIVTLPKDEQGRVKPEALQKIGLGEAVRLVTEGFRMERVARGQPADMTQTNQIALCNGWIPADVEGDLTYGIQDSQI